MIARMLALIISLSFIITQVAFGHSGRTDENGGHWDHQKKEYHYHTKDGVKVDKEKSATYDERDVKNDGEKKVMKKDKKVKIRESDKDDGKKDLKEKKKDKKENKLNKNIKDKKDGKSGKKKKSDKPKKEKKIKKKNAKKMKNND